MKTNFPSTYRRSSNEINRIKDLIEALEPRIAPAVIIVTPHTATYTDVDGDQVTIKVSKGVLTAANFVTAPAGLGDQLQTIDLSAGGFDDANLTMTVKKAAGGDGQANIGYLNSIGHDLGSVTLRGDLGQIDAGDANTADGAMKALSVRSMGRFGVDTQAAGGDLISGISGTVGKLTVSEDIINVNITIFDLLGGTNGRLGSLTIGGSLIGGADDNSGSIFTYGDMGPVKIGRDVQGGAGIFSGRLASGGKLTSVTVGGSVIGGSNTGSGTIDGAGDMGPVKIAHNLQGGAGDFSGGIEVDGKLASVTIGGSLIGGTNTYSGSITSLDDIGAVRIGGDLSGGSITGNASLEGSGFISAGGRIAGITIGGSIVSGIDTSTGALIRNASIRAQDSIGSLTVRGSIAGNSAGDTSPVIISARGEPTPGANSDVAIGKITVGGRVEFAQILAGYDVNLAPVNGNASIGPVKVGGAWVASNLVAGVAAGGDGLFGTADDVSIGGTLIARIASIVIDTQVIGTPSSISTDDHFGFVAERIGSFRAGQFVASLTSGTDVVELSPITGDVTLREV